MKVCNDIECPKRGILQPASNFDRLVSGHLGRAQKCKVCRKRRATERRKRIADEKMLFDYNKLFIG